MVGKKFGRWTVIKIVSMGRRPRVEVVCDCGTISVVAGNTLVTKGKSKSTSCGCFQRERIKECLGLPADVAAINQYYSIYKTSAAMRNYEFSLSKIEFKELIFQSCFYCGNPPSPRKIHSKRIIMNVSGIDRVDNSIGYQRNNCVPCCKPCNNKKGDISKEIILKLYKRLYENA